MLLTKAPSVLNGVHVMEIQIEVLAPSMIKMLANYALVSAIGQDEEQRFATHGKCTAYPSNWSKNTMELLKELLKSMETDLLPRHFDIKDSEQGTLTELGELDEDEGAQV